MSVPKRLLLIFVLLVMGNSPLLFARYSPAIPLAVLIALCLGALLLWCSISPGFKAPSMPKKLRQLEEGCALYETTLLIAVLLLLEHAALPLFPGLMPSLPLFWGSLLAGMGLLIFPLTSCLLRLIYSAEQLSSLYRYIMLTTWWIPMVSVFLNIPTYRAAKRELRFIRMQHQRNLERREQQICHTKFPLLLLHINFYPNRKPETCWGRIPEALQQNGAVLYYGGPPSSPSVSLCAEELQAVIAYALARSGCEKVNIIAHSKRGWDARYAISELGLAHQVASLTTICTPHRGCLFAEGALDHLPGEEPDSVPHQRDRLLSQMNGQYPDFYSMVAELTPKACAALNQSLPDAPGVYYQSVGAKMASEGSAKFPMKASYRILQPLAGDNDGLVATSSMPWGEQYTEVAPLGAQGISHGDMIDLNRRNIPGFDVCEFYVELVQALKDRGL